MKKILFIFVLSLYSIQGFASSCPDGSEPVRSISDDGTYYVFNCSEPVSTSEDSSPRSSKLLPDKLKEIKVVKDWEPIADWESVKEYAKLVPIPRWKNESIYDQYVDRNCSERFTSVNPYPGDNPSARIFAHCQSYLHAASSNNPQILGDILLSWASASKDPMFVVPYEVETHEIKHSVAGYNIPSAIGTFAQSYAFWYDEIAYTPEERQRVDDYMTKKLMEQKFLPISRDYNGPRIKCDINDLSSVYSERTGTNNCGNVRMKVAVGEIMLGFRLENQTLLDKGHDDMYVVHAFINEDGININHASRGGNTVNYSWEYTYYSSLLAEIYDSVGYDYFEHTLPRGAKVHEYLSFNYRLLKDFKLTAQWAKYNIGSLWLPYDQIKNLSQQLYEKTTNGGWAYSWEDGDKEFVKAHTKFVKRYMPELYNFDVKNYMGSNFNDSPNFGVHPYMLHIGNNVLEENSNTSKIELLRQAKLQEEIDQCAKATSDSGFNGEYEAKWFRDHWNGNGEWEFVGSEPLILDQCEGEFEGLKQFDPRPTPAVRKKLIVKYQSNGDISIKGDLNLYTIDDLRYTELYGNINDGEISGVWGFGNRLKIEFSKKPKPTELFDGRYSFELFRYAEDEADDIGNGIINISNGQITIDESNRNLQTGDSDLYDTFSGQVDKNGDVSGSVKLDIYSSGQKSEEFFFEGLIDEEIWGESPIEDFFKVYMKLKKQ
ncbi:hypothetical protein ACMAZA_00480 [Pseudothioglobus sp. nBUS_23]|uniref:hypothetical protein n=1 Tax=Pseudothioglobus sp. nBUS_23 TaxID=3395318 RepID=UPI003EB9F764